MPLAAAQPCPRQVLALALVLLGGPQNHGVLVAAVRSRGAPVNLQSNLEDFTVDLQVENGTQPVKAGSFMVGAPKPVDKAHMERHLKHMQIVKDALNDMLETLAKEEKEEASNFKEYGAWCSSEISGFKKSLEETELAVETNSVSKKEVQARVAETKSTIDENAEQEKKNEDVVAQEEELDRQDDANYQRDLTINMQSIKQIDAAVDIVGKVFKAKTPSSFLQGEEAAAAQGAGVAKQGAQVPGESSYILGIMKRLRTALQETRTKMMKQQETQEKTSNALVHTKTEALDNLESEKAGLKSKLGQARVEEAEVSRDLARAERKIPNFQKSIDQTKAMCEAKAKDWAIRKRDRYDEQNAIRKALGFLEMHLIPKLVAIPVETAPVVGDSIGLVPEEVPSDTVILNGVAPIEALPNMTAARKNDLGQGEDLSLGDDAVDASTQDANPKAEPMTAAQPNTNSSAATVHPTVPTSSQNHSLAVVSTPKMTAEKPPIHTAAAAPPVTKPANASNASDPASGDIAAWAGATPASDPTVSALMGNNPEDAEELAEYPADFPDPADSSKASAPVPKVTQSSLASQKAQSAELKASRQAPEVHAAKAQSLPAKGTAPVQKTSAAVKAPAAAKAPVAAKVPKVPEAAKALPKAAVPKAVPTKVAKSGSPPSPSSRKAVATAAPAAAEPEQTLEDVVGEGQIDADTFFSDSGPDSVPSVKNGAAPSLVQVDSGKNMRSTGTLALFANLGIDASMKSDAVKKVVNDLIAQLQKDQDHEDTTIAGCRKGLDEKADAKLAAENEIKKLTAEIALKNATMSRLDTEVAELRDDVDEQQAGIKNATQIRYKEHKTHHTQSQDRNLSLKVIAQTKTVLQRFYASPDVTGLLLDSAKEGQSNNSTKHESTDAPDTWYGSTRQESKGGQVIDLLDRITEDITNEQRTADLEEKESAEAFEKLKEDGKDEFDAMMAEITERMKRIATMTVRKRTNTEEQGLAEQEKTSIEAQIAALHQSCDEIIANHKARTKARDFEISQLRDVLDIISGSQLAVRTGTA